MYCEWHGLQHHTGSRNIVINVIIIIFIINSSSDNHHSDQLKELQQVTVTCVTSSCSHHATRRYDLGMDDYMSLIYQDQTKSYWLNFEVDTTADLLLITKSSTILWGREFLGCPVVREVIANVTQHQQSFSRRDGLQSATEEGHSCSPLYNKAKVDKHLNN